MAVKNYYIIPYERENETCQRLVGEIAKNLREEDVTEILAQGYTNIEEVLKISLETSEIALLATDKNGKGLCAFGKSLLNTEYGTLIWCVGTSIMERYKREFLSSSAHMIDEWRKQGSLYNYVDARNKKALRWLKWLGAKFSEPFSFGVNGEKFILFVIEGGRKYVYSDGGAGGGERAHAIPASQRADGGAGKCL